MAVEVEQLVVALEARVSKFEKDMARAGRGGDRTFQQLTAGSSRATAKMEQDFLRSTTRINQALATTRAKVGEFSSAFKGGIFGGIGAGAAGAAAAAALAGIPAAIRAATASLAEMRAEAARAGLPVEDFQALAYAARQSKIPVDALTDGMKELQLRADEFIVTGSGAGAEAFARLGYTADELREKLKDPVALFGEIIDRLRSMDRAAQIRITDEVFGGTGGERFLALLQDSSRSITDLMDEARRLGVVLDTETVDKAAELDAKFNQIAETVETRLKSALVGAGDVVLEIGSYLKEIEKTLAGLGNASFWTKLSDWMGSTPEDRARAQLQFGLQRSGLGDRPDLSGWNGVRGGGAPTEITITAPNRMAGLDGDLQTKLSQFIADAAAQGLEIAVSSGKRSTAEQARIWAEALEKYGSPAEARKHAAPPGSSMHETGRAADITFGSQAAREWAAANANVYGLAFPVATETPMSGPANGHSHAHVEEAGSRSGGTRDAAAEAAKREADAIAKVNQALDDEAATLGMTEEQQRLYNALKEAGVTIDSAEGRAIADKVAALYDEIEARDAATAAAERQREQQEELTDAGKGFLSDLAHGLKDGKTWTEALTSALDRLTDRLLDMALDGLFDAIFPSGGSGGGGGFGFLGNIFSALFSGGSGGGVPLPLPKPAGMAGGGTTPRAGVYEVGERGRELLALPAGTSVIPNHQSNQMLAGGNRQNVQIIDQRRGGEKISTQKMTGPDGEEIVRVIVRDENARSNREGGMNERFVSSRGLAPRMRKSAA